MTDDKEPAKPSSFAPIKALVERQIESALHPSGMSVHDGKGRFEVSHIQYMLKYIEQLEREKAELKAQIPKRVWGNPAVD